MASINLSNLIQDAEVGGELALEIAMDVNEVKAGVPVTTPQVQVGTTGGAPLYASVTLTTTKM